MDGGWLEFFQTVMQTAGYAGAIVSIVAAVVLVLAWTKILPQLSKKAAGWVLGTSLLIFFAALMSPVVERLVRRVHTIDVVIRSQEGIIRHPFKARYRTSDRGVVTVEGRDGAAELRGVPVSVEKLEIVDLDCAGYRMRDPGPFTIDDGKVEVVMVPDEPPPPEDDKARPDPEPLRPASSDLDKSPAVPGKEVTLFYRNRTGKPLEIVLFNYAHDPKSNPWRVTAKWIDLVPNGAQLKTYEGFKVAKQSTGWFGIWLRDKVGQYRALRAVNLFIASEPLLTIVDGEDGQPNVTLEVRQPDDATL